MIVALAHTFTRMEPASSGHLHTGLNGRDKSDRTLANTNTFLDGQIGISGGIYIVPAEWYIYDLVRSVHLFSRVGRVRP